MSFSCHRTHVVNLLSIIFIKALVLSYHTRPLLPFLSFRSFNILLFFAFTAFSNEITFSLGYKKHHCFFFTQNYETTLTLMQYVPSRGPIRQEISNYQGTCHLTKPCSAVSEYTERMIDTMSFAFGLIPSSQLLTAAVVIGGHIGAAAVVVTDRFVCYCCLFFCCWFFLVFATVT